MMNAEPLVSIVMANYNNGAYLEQAIASVLTQTYKNWEIILVDDASSDDSMEIMTRYQDDPRISIFYNKCNLGVGFTKRKCVKHSSGEICSILDSDDALKETAIADVVQLFHENKTEKMVVGGLEYYDQKLENLIRQKSFAGNLGDKSILENGFASGWDSFLREAYDSTDGFDENQTAEDQDLYFKIEEVGDILFVENYLYKYRQHEKGTSQGKRGLNVMRDHLMAIESANARRNASGDYRIMAHHELNKRWENYYLLKAHDFFQSGQEKLACKSVWNSFRKKPFSKLFHKLNLLFHPLKPWKDKIEF